MRKDVDEHISHTALLDSYLSRDQPTIAKALVNNGWQDGAINSVPQKHKPKQPCDLRSEYTGLFQASSSCLGTGTQNLSTSASWSAAPLIECTEQPRTVLPRLPFVSQSRGIRSDLSQAGKQDAVKDFEVSIRQVDEKDFMSALSLLRHKYGRACTPSGIADDGPKVRMASCPNAATFRQLGIKGSGRVSSNGKGHQIATSSQLESVCANAWGGAASELDKYPATARRPACTDTRYEEMTYHHPSTRSTGTPNALAMRKLHTNEGSGHERDLACSAWLSQPASNAPVRAPSSSFGASALSPAVSCQQSCVTPCRVYESRSYDAPITPRTPLTDSLRAFFTRHADAAHAVSDMPAAPATRSTSLQSDATGESGPHPCESGPHSHNPGTYRFDAQAEGLVLDGALSVQHDYSRVQLTGTDNGRSADATVDAEVRASQAHDSTNGIEFIRAQYPHLFRPASAHRDESAWRRCWQEASEPCDSSSVAMHVQSPLPNAFTKQMHDRAEPGHGGRRHVPLTTESGPSIHVTASLEHFTAGGAGHEESNVDSQDKNATCADEMAKDAQVSGLSDRASKLLVRSLAAARLGHADSMSVCGVTCGDSGGTLHSQRSFRPDIQISLQRAGVSQGTIDMVVSEQR